ncbi:MAG: selenide, water dikinase SelD [Proteobacteria bacterium]|nr:selenide, water dikinase SelD [Pseudomonadota bacterium]
MASSELPNGATIRLTEYARGGGCAAKLRLADLSKVLDHLPGRTGAARADIVVDHAFSDDAAVVHALADRFLVMTADIIAPLVDDPATFGAIAATNAMSDVWAMGGEPRFALNLVFFSDDTLPLAVLDDILAGSADACARAGVAVVGGHSVRDPEIKFGLSVTGDVAPDRIWSNRTARPGQALVLTKALGTGVISQAVKKGIASPAAAAAAAASMTTLNRGAMTLGHRFGVTAATDVTGFGLLGHLRNICRGSGLGARVELAALPVLPTALAHLANDICPGGSKANRAYVAALVTLDGAPLADVPPEATRTSPRELLASLACDAQTSGGLLLCVPADRADDLVAALRDDGLPASRIGELVPADDRAMISLA